MVTIESITKFGLYSWLVKYSSSLEDPTFYIYLDGNLIAETQQTEYSLAVNIDENSVIEILDDADEQPLQIFPGRMRLGWFFVEDTNYYRIDEYISSAWIERHRMPESGGYMSWLSRVLEDGQTHTFRIVPVGTNGNEGTAKQFAILMCRRPDVPDAGYTYNEGAKKVIVSDNDSPPNDLINHCVVNLLMDDNAASTTVVDQMEYSDGTAQQNTNVLHTEDNALSFNGTTDYINSNKTYQDIFKDSFSISFEVNMPNINPNGLKSYFFFGHECFDPSMGFMFGCFNDGTKNLQCIYEVGPGDVVGAIVNGDFTLFDQWVHFQIIVEKLTESTAAIRIYQNGQLLDTIINGGTVHMANYNAQGLNLHIGKCNSTSACPIQGKMRRFRIFNKALTAADLNWLYNGGNGREDW